MSRYNGITKNGYRSAYGFNLACGYFLVVMDENGDPIVNIDSFLDGLTGGGLVNACEKHGVDMYHLHRSLALMDLAF